jgi:uncharacterized protein YktA (UPF0223 family)
MFALNESILSPSEINTLQHVAKTYEVTCPEISTAWDSFKSIIKSKMEAAKSMASIQELETIASIAAFLVNLNEKITQKQASINARKEQLLETIDDHLSSL